MGYLLSPTLFHFTYYFPQSINSYFTKWLYDTLTSLLQPMLSLSLSAKVAFTSHNQYSGWRRKLSSWCDKKSEQCSQCKEKMKMVAIWEGIKIGLKFGEGFFVHSLCTLSLIRSGLHKDVYVWCMRKLFLKLGSSRF